ncbi:MAG: hypothetical protein QME28_09580 [Candidatus Saccharicenans sp.]|nr:hypothetical protein [Candidatus Saccharicenans sp.]
MHRGIVRQFFIFFVFWMLFFSLSGLFSEAQSQFDSIRLEDIRSAHLSSARISGNSLAPNTILLFSTNEGRFGKLLIKSSDYNLTLAWVTFNADGTVYSSGDNLTIRGTFTCDLDSGQESRNSADFWWQISSPTERYLTPRNGAAFAIYSPASQASARELTSGRRVATTTTDTSKTAESAIQTEKARQVQVEAKPSSLFKKREQPLPGQMTAATGEPPASFQNVRYRFKDSVRIIRGDFQNNIKVAEEITQRKTIAITPGNKLVQGALIEPQIIDSQLRQPAEIGSIIYDENTRLAAKIVGKSTIQNRIYYTLLRPQLNEVLEEFEIPQQTVRLTSGNITPLTPSAVRFQYRQTVSNVVSLRSGERWHIKNPWLKIEFDDVPLVAYTSGGRSVSVRLSGRIGLTPIDVNGRYSCFSGYEFKLSSGEEISLKVTVAMNVKEDMKIPLFAIDIPALIATIRGGFYLLVGVDGRFTLGAEVTEWLEAEAGVSGRTFFWMPTGFNPFFRLNKGFETETFFAGQINGYVKAGPLLELELLGWNLVGAGGLIGIGIDCQILGWGSESLLDVDIYASLELYATLFGYRVNFVNNTFNLYHLQKPNTVGYDINYTEACAWRGKIWGVIRRDLGNGKFEPVSDTLKLKVERNNQIVDTVTVQSDSEGRFEATVPLFKEDRIRLINVGRETINSAAVSPTIPFREVRLEYADFFNDASKGQVIPARVKNWSTGEWEYISYDGNIRFNNGAVTTCDRDGNFVLSYDFKPGQNVVASIDFHGFKVDSPGIKTDVAFMGKRFVERSDLIEYSDSSGRFVEKRVDREHFQVINLRGEKQPSLPVDYRANYYHYVTLSRVYEYFTGRPIVPPVLLGTKNYSFRLSPVDSGTSEIVEDFTEEWGWLADGSRTSSSRQNLEVGKATGVTVQARPQFKVAKGPQLISRSAPFFRYDSDKTRAQGNPVDEGVQTILRDGTLVIDYEGAEIEVKDLNQEIGQGHEIPQAGVNPGQWELIERVVSRINPVRLSSIDPISRRIVAPINSIRIKREMRR